MRITFSKLCIIIIGPLPPLNLLITPINTSILRLSWNSTSTFRWPNYQIDGFSVNVTNINSSQKLLEASMGFQNSIEIGRFNLSIDVLQPCTKLKFSVSSISATYGESVPSFIIGGFPEGFYIIIINRICYNNNIIITLESEASTNFGKPSITYIGSS